MILIWFGVKVNAYWANIKILLLNSDNLHLKTIVPSNNVFFESHAKKIKKHSLIYKTVFLFFFHYKPENFIFSFFILFQFSKGYKNKITKKN